MSRISISNLEKHVTHLAEQLSAEGMVVEVTVYRSGRGAGDRGYGVPASYVDLDIEAGDDYTSVRYISGGYVVTERYAFGGNDSWRVMRAKSLAYILRHLPGWVPAAGSIFLR